MGNIVVRAIKDLGVPDHVLEVGTEGVEGGVGVVILGFEFIGDGAEVYGLRDDGGVCRVKDVVHRLEKLDGSAVLFE